MKFDFGWKTPNLHRLAWDDLVVGYEHQWDMPITLDTVAWYADLSEDPNPWYGGYGALGSPWDAPVAPPLLMSRLSFRLTDPLGKMTGFVNTRNRTETLAPTLVGTVAHFHGRIAEKLERKGRQYVRYVIDVTNAESGQPLLHEEKEYIVATSATTAAAGAVTSGTVSTPASGTAAPATSAPATRMGLQDSGATAGKSQSGKKFKVGQELPGFEYTITGMVMRTRQWRGTNVVHSDPAEAAKHGMKRPPATGQISAAHIQRMCVDFFGAAIFSHSIFEVRFRAPVFEDETLVIGGKVVEVLPQPEGQKVVADTWCRNQEGVEVTRAQVEVFVPPGAA